MSPQKETEKEAEAPADVAAADAVVVFEVAALAAVATFDTAALDLIVAIDTADTLCAAGHAADVAAVDSCIVYTVPRE